MHAVLTMVAQRLALGLVTLFIVSVIIFGAVQLLPGNVAEAILGQGATEENVKAFLKQRGLDGPPILLYIKWIGGVLSFDFGESWANGREVSELLSTRLPNTLFLASMAALFSVPLAIGLGLLAALYRNSIFDRGINVSTLTAISSPEFFVAYVLIVIFAINMGVFPAISNISSELPFLDRAYRTLLPAFTLTLVVTAHMMRMTRAAIINLLNMPFIEMATLKGVDRREVITKHALPNAWAPIINVVVLNLAYLIVGVVVVEVVFVYPGMGQLLIDSVTRRDFPVVQACCLIFAATYILLNLTADVLSILTNPRLLHPR